ncbi:MAG TPA: GTP-binding protein, partial [Intrasporangium sp.]|nr:GTP-binding protein [Intrasporangium sp.]
MEFAPPSLTLGIVAHVDAGKTSLTERLLHAAGVIDELGTVDEGSTQTDTLDLERQRGITIRASVVSFELGQPDRPVTVNLVDTPGHSDFIAEVERSVDVLDGAVLVISAVEGVQAQTRVLMRVLTRLRIPTLLYVNKIDRPGARGQSLLTDIRERLTDKAIPLGGVTGAGTSSAAYVPFGKDDERHRARLADLLSEHDDALLRDWVGNADGVTTRRLERALAQQARTGLVHPLLHGSAVTGAGLDEVARAIATYLPVRRPDVGGPLAGSVFKVERGRSGEKLALVRLTRGRLGVRDKVRFGDVADRVTAIRVHDRGMLVRSTSVAAGRMAEVVGLESARVGDPIGDGALEHRGPQFSPPTLETVVEPVRPVDRGRMYAALTRLAETDPLIN